MRQQSREYIVILFVVGALVLNYPMLDLFDRPWMPLGVPLLYFYLYLVWFVLIVLLVVVVQHSEIQPDRPKTPRSENASQAESETAAIERRQADDTGPAESP